MNQLQTLKLEYFSKDRDTKMSWKTVVAFQQAFLKDHTECNKCHTKANLTYDHIIPIMLLRDFNIDAQKNFWEENGQALCHACNGMKSGHLDFSNPQTIINLKILISKLEEQKSEQ